MPVRPTLPYRCHPFPDHCIFLLISACLEYIHDSQSCRLLRLDQVWPDLSGPCDSHVSQLHLFSRISFLQRKVQPSQAECNRDLSGRSTAVLRSVCVNHVLVDKPGVLSGHRVALEVGICLQALTRCICPARWVQMLVGNSYSAAGTYNHGCFCSVKIFMF